MKKRFSKDALSKYNLRKEIEDELNKCVKSWNTITRHFGGFLSEPEVEEREDGKKYLLRRLEVMLHMYKVNDTRIKY